MNFLKKALFIITLAVVPVAANAEFRYGAALGVDFTTLKFRQPLISVDQATGFQAGVQGEMMFPGIGFGVDIGAFYTMRGATIHFSEKKIWAHDGIGNPHCYLHYLEIPVNLRFKWTRMGGIEDYVAPFVFGGPEVSFLVAHNSVKPLEYAGADVGVQCGFGLEIMRRWQVSGAYTWGMTYALKTKKLTNFSARNRTWTARVVYFF